MNARERFLRQAGGQPVDRVFYLEESLRREVLERWYGEKLSRNVTEDNYPHFFGLDRYAYIYLPLEPRKGTLRGKEDFRRVEEDYRRHPAEFRRQPFWKKKAQEYRDRDFPLGIMGWRGFMLPLFTHETEWESFQDVLLALQDYPEEVKRLLHLVADCFVEAIELAVTHLKPEFGIVSEPIASPSGPGGIFPRSMTTQERTSHIKTTSSIERFCEKFAKRSRDILLGARLVTPPPNRLLI